MVRRDKYILFQQLLLFFVFLTVVLIVFTAAILDRIQDVRIQDRGEGMVRAGAYVKRDIGDLSYKWIFSHWDDKYTRVLDNRKMNLDRENYAAEVDRVRDYAEICRKRFLKDSKIKDLEEITPDMVKAMSPKDHLFFDRLCIDAFAVLFGDGQFLADMRHIKRPLYVEREGDNRLKVRYNSEKDFSYESGDYVEVLSYKGKPNRKIRTLNEEIIKNRKYDRVLFFISSGTPDDTRRYAAMLMPIDEKDESLGYLLMSWSVFGSYRWIQDFAEYHLSEVFAVLLLMGVLYLFFLNRLILHPIKAIKKALQKFVDSKNLQYLREDLHNVRSQNEIGRLAVYISTVATDLVLSVAERRKMGEERAVVQAELELASKIQVSLLPKDFPTWPEEKRFELFASMTPAEEVGGDFYDFFLIDDDHLALVIADVSDKGIPAAFFMMEAKMIFKGKAQPGRKPAQIMEAVNRSLMKYNEAEQFITAWFMIVTLSTGEALGVNAGHTKPVLMRAKERYELVKNKHFPMLAVMDGLKYKENVWQFQKGDKLFVYTDGVTEAMNAGGEQFGDRRMLDALNEAREGSQEEILGNVQRRVGEHAKGFVQSDDLTMLGFTYYGPEGGSDSPSDEG